MRVGARMSVGSLALLSGVVLLAPRAQAQEQEAGRADREERGEATASAEAGGVSAEEAQAFLGYWLLKMELMGRPVEMGLALTGRDGQVSGSLLSRFGELEAQSFRMQGDALHFDLHGPFGKLLIESRIEDKDLVGRFGDESGAFAADFRGIHSDRAELQRFRRPENETRLGEEGEMIRVRYADPPAGERDFQQVEEAEAGQVVRFLEHGAIKLMTDVPLRFGDLLVATENVAADYPGVYSLWLKRTESGWSLTFNEKPDVWGTQYQPQADVGEVPLIEGEADEPSEELVAELEETEEGGVLHFTWGTYRWSAPFEITTQ